MRRFLTLLLVAGIGAGAGADDLSGPGRKTLVSEPWGTIFCREGATVHTDASGTRHRISTPQGTMTLARTGESWLLQAPNQNMVVRPPGGLSGGDRLAVQFNATRYLFERVGNDYIWNFPGKRVFFRLREGEIRGALGDDGAFKMHKKAGGIAYEIESEQGETQVTLGRKKRKGVYHYVVVRQTGEELKLHPYMVRGVVFDNGPVGVFVKMPRNPVLEALDWSLVQTVTSTIPYPGAAAEEAPGEASSGRDPVLIDPQKMVDPLQAPQAAPDEDPFKLKRKPYEKDRSMFDLPKPPAEDGSQWSQPPR